MKKIIVTLGLFLATTALADYQLIRPITRGGTGSSTQSPLKAVTTDANGNVVSTSATTATQIGYLSNVTSDLQAQINAISSGFVNTTLSNLTSPTAINQNLLPNATNTFTLGSASLLWNIGAFNTLDVNSIQSPTGGTIAISSTLLSSGGQWNLGSATSPFGTSYSLGVGIESSGSGANGNVITLVSPATPTNHTITLPSTVCASGQTWTDNGSGVMSCATISTGANTTLSNLTSPTAVNEPLNMGSNAVTGLPTPVNSSDAATKSYVDTSIATTQPKNFVVVNAGNNATVTIAAGTDMEVANTTLTAASTWTLPPCTTVGQHVILANPEGQTYAVTVVPNGSDTELGLSSYVLNAEDSATWICRVSGKWTIN